MPRLSERAAHRRLRSACVETRAWACRLARGRVAGVSAELSGRSGLSLRVCSSLRSACIPCSV